MQMNEGQAVFNRRAGRRGRRPDLKGLHARLYMIMIIMAGIIVLVTGLVQIFSVRRSLRQDTRTQVQEIARNISSTYGTSAYEGSVRAAIYTGDYLVRSISEQGEILIDTGDLSFYVTWPDIELDLDDILERLEESEGYFFLETEDPDGITWVVYCQLVARWEGQREILMVAKNTVSEEERIQRLVTLMLGVLAITLALAFVLCWFVTKSFLKPIENITDKATALLRDDYSVHFSEDSYTELNKLSRTLNMAVDSMANYEQMRRDMIANVSHDMRTPLTMIKAYAEMIQTISGDDPVKRNHHLDVIIQQADKLSDFVNKSLDLAVMQADERTFNFEVFSLDQFVWEMISQIEGMDEGKHAFCVYADPGCYVRADKSGIDEIITNLVSNAMKYGGDRIEIYVQRFRDKVRLAVVDYGEGIPRDKLGMIWNKYYRINPHGEDASSAGVGLSIVKEIADSHHLMYGVESDVGKGVQIWFEFPLVKEP